MQQEETPQEPTEAVTYLQFKFGDEFPVTKVLETADSEFGFLKDNSPVFTKTVKWSPDGLCLLSNSEDNKIRLFEMPADLLASTTQTNTLKEWKKCLSVSEPGTIYDYSWYPFMNSSDPATCCFLTASHAQPVHMWDAFTGKLRQSYTCMNQYDEVISPFSVSFNQTGDKIYCGMKDFIRVFDTLRPGSSYDEVACVERVLHKKRNKTVTKLVGQTGIISCLAFNKQNIGMYAAGSYDKTVGIYDEDSNQLQHLLEGRHRGGVTQVLFSANGVLLFSGARKDNTICCYDVRNTTDPLFLFDLERKVDTNQKISFDVDIFTKYLITGSERGEIWVFDLQTGTRVSTIDTGAKDSVNGATYHPYLPYFAISTGERCFNSFKAQDNVMEDSDSEEKEQETLFEASRVAIYNTSCDRIAIS